MRDDRARIRDMIEAIGKIEKYAPRGREVCVNDELLRTYIVHQLQILGEAGNKLSADLRSRHPEVPWPRILGMRHIIVHDYFRVDYGIVWDVVETELPDLKRLLKAVLKSLEGSA
ncbi:MAG: DUF86 domain-containing protein [Desulfomonilaceae bacterium]|nr:DUF86 domain-containing protein [Desulfomonilaceae bacterium]